MLRVFQMITLSMIVKNEQELLPACLKSIKDWVSDIIIVDTGSTDDTVGVAHSFGARVESFVWRDDFSAARNHSLSFVNTPWTLFLDADDLVLNPELIAGACEFARSKRISGLWGHYLQDESSFQRRLQIFKTKDFTWKGFVHESPIAKHPKTETTYCDLKVLHRKPQSRRPQAALKYLEILEAKDPENWFGIAESYRFLSIHPDKPENIGLYQRNAEELFYRAANTPGVNGATRFIALLYCAQLNLRIAAEDKDTQRLEHALRLLQICYRLEPQRAEPLTMTGLVYEALGEPKAATSCYERALKLPLYDKVGLVLKDYYQNIPQARLEALCGT